MAINIHNLIAAIVPDVYCEKTVEKDGKWIELRKEVKKIVKEEGYLKAAEIAKPTKSQSRKRN